MRNIEDYLKKTLNEEQWEAVRYNDGNLLILAGAGTGKTRVITYKIYYILEVLGGHPGDIMAVTFTNKAATEMKERILNLLNTKTYFPYIGTFHAISLKLLRSHADLLGYDKSRLFIIDDKEQLEMIKRVISELKLSSDSYFPARARYFIDRQKNLFISPEEAQNEKEEELVEIYRAYQQKLKMLNAMDFGDILFNMVVLLRQEPVLKKWYRNMLKYILVDEFQDTNHIQFLLLKELASEDTKLTVVGDDDQSIYSWRGADISNIIEFPKHFKNTKIVKLVKNYRSTPTILKVANAVIKNNRYRHEKSLVPMIPDNKEKVVIKKCFDEYDEARYVVRQIKRLQGRVSLNDIAIFYRTNAQSRVLEEVLRSELVPYRIYGGFKFFERAEIKDILSYIRLSLNHKDDMSLDRIINTPTRGIGRQTVNQLFSISTQKGCSAFEAIPILVKDSSFKARSRKKALENFYDMIFEFEKKSDEMDPVSWIEFILEKSGYLKSLEKMDSPEALQKIENIKEFVKSVGEFFEKYETVTMQDYLDHVSLMSASSEEKQEMDEASGEKNEFVSLMTVHSAKGLEFHTVFIVGLEKDLFPHFNSQSPAEIEEERRLCYVAITRAREKLYLTHCATRKRFNRMTDLSQPSIFLKEIEGAFRTNETANISGDVLAPSSGTEKLNHSSGAKAGGKKSSSGIRVGKKIKHKKFGIGVVEDIQKIGKLEILVVKFNNFGTMKIPYKKV